MDGNLFQEAMAIIAGCTVGILLFLVVIFILLAVLEDRLSRIIKLLEKIGG